MSKHPKFLRWPSLLAALVIAAVTQRADAAVIYSIEHNGDVYALLAPDTWENSQAQAQALGGHLVTINNMDEHNFVYNTFAPIALSHAPATGKVNLWIGMWDPTMDGSYAWIDGSPVDFMNFFPDQPQQNFDDEMYMGIRVRGRNDTVPVGKLIDIVGDDRLGDLNFGVVRITESPSVPEPATWAMLVPAVAVMTFVMLRRRNVQPQPLRVRARR